MQIETQCRLEERIKEMEDNIKKDFKNTRVGTRVQHEKSSGKDSDQNEESCTRT